jgi:acyl dehydratase
MSTTPLSPWQITATNLAEHARNPIHTDAGGRAAGFDGALVAGVTTYAYLCHVPLAGWGESWISSGGGEVRFRRPVLDGDVLDILPTSVDGDEVTIEVRSSRLEQPRAVLRCRPEMGSAPALRPGEDLDTVEVMLDGPLGADYAMRAGDDLQLPVALGIVHPAVWTALANDVVHTQLARGAWIHTRSIVRHHQSVPIGSTAIVRSRVVERFVGHGERAVVDVHITVNGEIAASLEHEAIIALP